METDFGLGTGGGQGRAVHVGGGRQLAVLLEFRGQTPFKIGRGELLKAAALMGGLKKKMEQVFRAADFDGDGKKTVDFGFATAERASSVAIQQDGKIVALKDTIRGFKAIIAGEYDHLPEQAFYMIGAIEEAVEKAKSLA